VIAIVTSGCGTRYCTSRVVGLVVQSHDVFELLRVLEQDALPLAPRTLDSRGT